MPYSKQDKRLHGAASSWYRVRHTKAGPLGAGNAVRRRVRRVVGVGTGLPRHEWEVEGVVVHDDAVRYSASVAAHAMLKRMSQNDEATIVLHVCFRAGDCDMRILSNSLPRP